MTSKGGGKHMPLSCSEGPISLTSGDTSDKLLRFLFDITLWRLLAVLGLPFRRLVAFNVFLGRSVWNIAADLRRLVWRAVGWLYAPINLPEVLRLGHGLVHVRRWHLSVAALLVAGVLNKLISRWRESFDPLLRRKFELVRIMKTALTYEEWREAAHELDQMESLDPSRAIQRWNKERKLFDRRLLLERLQYLRAVRRKNDVAELAFAVRADLLRNLGNMTNSELHEHWHVAPDPIPEYNAEVISALNYLADYTGPEFSFEDKLAFLQETRHTFGRTALVLSGGGALGAFHLGVAKTLFESGLLPRVLSGSSVGSIVCSVLATRTDEELRETFAHLADFDLSFFSNSTAAQFFQHFIRQGTLQDMSVLQKRMRRLLGDLTFLDAFKRSGRTLNIAVTAADTNEPPRLLNHLTAPDVVVWSAVSCSSAFPMLFKPQELLSMNRRTRQWIRDSVERHGERERRWRDGSLEEDLPMRGLSEMWNVNYFLVSQTNPHIVPALNLKNRFNRKLGKLLESEWKHRCHQLMEVLPEWLPSKVLKVLSQPWEGDVTMVLPSTYSQIKKAITNPSREDLHEATLQGERATWAKISAIQCNCGIEMALDSCLLRVTAAYREAKKREARASNAAAYTAAQQPPQGPPGPPGAPRMGAPGGGFARNNRMQSRIPSWLHLQSLGIPYVHSNDSMEGGALANINLVAHAGPAAEGAFPAAMELEDSDPDDIPPLELPETLDVAALAEGDDRPLPFDCCDRSVNIWGTNIWGTRMPAAALSIGQGLDVIAP